VVCNSLVCGIKTENNLKKKSKWNQQVIQPKWIVNSVPQKKLILTLVFALVSAAPLCTSHFDKFDGQVGVTSIIVNKKMFDLMSKVKWMLPIKKRNNT
jgi:hypothetical protein